MPQYVFTKIDIYRITQINLFTNAVFQVNSKQFYILTYLHVGTYRFPYLAYIFSFLRITYLNIEIHSKNYII